MTSTNFSFDFVCVCVSKVRFSLPGMCEAYFEINIHIVLVSVSINTGAMLQTIIKRKASTHMSEGSVGVQIL